MNSPRYLVENARISIDASGELKVSISVEIKGTARLYGKDVDINDRRIVRHNRVQQKMDPAIVKAFWDEVNRATGREMEPGKFFDEKV